MNLFSTASTKWHVVAIFSGAHSRIKTRKVKVGNNPLTSQKMFFAALAYHASL